MSFKTTNHELKIIIKCWTCFVYSSGYTYYSLILLKHYFFCLMFEVSNLKK